MNKQKVCVIICGGPEDISDIVIPDGSYIICADSGYDKAIGRDIVPDLLIGDFDSIKSSIPENIQRIHLPKEKDDTDTMFCVRTALKNGYDKIILTGACKGREDHFIANIQTLKFIRNNHAEGCILGNDTDVFYMCGNEELFLPYKHDRYLSVFSLSKTSVVSLEGTEYKADRLMLSSDIPLGVSNRIVDEKAHITLFDGEIIVMSVRERV